ncbi:MAG: hypothetical protein AAGG01_22910 [Planctomycetota bacterium]
MTDRNYLPFLFLALLASFLPWTLGALDVTESTAHGGTWFATWPVLLCCAAFELSSKRAFLLLAAAVAWLVVAIELPGVWGQAFDAPDSAMGRHLARLSREYLAAYAALAVAGFGLAWASRRG